MSKQNPLDKWKNDKYLMMKTTQWLLRKPKVLSSHVQVMRYYNVQHTVICFLTKSFWRKHAGFLQEDFVSLEYFAIKICIIEFKSDLFWIFMEKNQRKVGWNLEEQDRDRFCTYLCPAHQNFNQLFFDFSHRYLKQIWFNGIFFHSNSEQFWKQITISLSREWYNFLIFLWHCALRNEKDSTFYEQKPLTTSGKNLSKEKLCKCQRLLNMKQEKF